MDAETVRDRIHIRDLRLRCIVGTNDDEREQQQGADEEQGARVQAADLGAVAGESRAHQRRQKLGQPEPESYFSCDPNKGSPQPAQ